MAGVISIRFTGCSGKKITVDLVYPVTNFYNSDKIMEGLLAALLSQQIPESIAEKLIPWYKFLARKILKRYFELPAGNDGIKMIVGVSGSQGSGKTTLASVLPIIINELAGITADWFSIDDVYRTRTERADLSTSIHPLFITRGVPGTHDLTLAEQTIKSLFKGSGKIPSFDKGSDDRVPECDWRLIEKPVDIVIVEGWCLGCPPLPEENMNLPLNELEAFEDPDFIWRNKVNTFLKTEYADFFTQFNYLIFFNAPDFNDIFMWRRLQEEKLKLTRSGAPGLMDESSLKRFIWHYERITRYMMETMPAISNTVINLGKDHGIFSMLENFSNHQNIKNWQ